MSDALHDLETESEATTLARAIQELAVAVQERPKDNGPFYRFARFIIASTGAFSY